MLNDFSPEASFVNRWAVVSSRPDLGYGQLVRKNPGGGVVVRYVDVPGIHEVKYVADFAEVSFPSLARGTRVWLRGRHHGWVPAEVIGPHGKGHYKIRPSETMQEVPVPETSLVVRWARPLADPLSAISAGMTESPRSYEARAPFVDEMTRQRRYSKGFSGVISAPVALYHHQLDTIARVMADPVMRYLLADEVGLGKSIEAGLIVRQVLVDEPDARVVVSTPSTLVDQWSDELRSRLLLGEAMQRGQLRVLDHDALAREREFDVDYLVVDEAPRILDVVERNPQVQRLFQEARGVLALSATPMRGDPRTLRRLLCLVDHQAFADMSDEAFAERLNMRERDAADLELLRARRTSLDRRHAILAAVQQKHPSDDQLAELINACSDVDDPLSPRWSDVATYVRETYRISRRMIRHRRGGELTALYPVAGRRVEYVEINEPLRSTIDAFLEELPEQVTGPLAVSDYANLVEHGLAGPESLGAYLDEVLEDGHGDGREGFDQQRPLLKAMRARLRLAHGQVRLRVALAQARVRIGQGKKVVVVAMQTDVARRFLDMAKAELGSASCRAHFDLDDQNDRDQAVWDFLAPEGASLLVADASLEEGRNLQEAHTLVNLDLPLDPNRLEQRIGRLDRYSVHDSPAEIVVFVEPESPWVACHVRVLHEGVGIFTGSVATMQMKIGQFHQEVRENLLTSGLSALDVPIEKLQQELAHERAEIDLLEEIESFTSMSDFDNAGFDDLLRGDEQVSPLEAAITALTRSRFGIELQIDSLSEGRVRFRANPVVAGVTRACRDELARVAAVYPRSFGRAEAVVHGGTGPLRLGDPLVEMLRETLESDPRGRAFAIARPSDDVEVPSLWVLTDYLIEYDDGPLDDLPSKVRRRLRRRGDAHFPPLVVGVWCDHAGPADEGRLVQLERPFDDATDTVLRGNVWKVVLEELPDWVQLCKASSEVADSIVRTHPDVQAARESALTSVELEREERLTVLRARARRLPSATERLVAQQELKIEADISDALLRGVGSPRVSRRAMGAVVLWPAHRY
jgi:ATP-dependent helicase HepA